MSPPKPRLRLVAFAALAVVTVGVPAGAWAAGSSGSPTPPAQVPDTTEPGDQLTGDDTALVVDQETGEEVEMTIDEINAGVAEAVRRHGDGPITYSNGEFGPEDGMHCAERPDLEVRHLCANTDEEARTLDPPDLTVDSNG